jgi:sterol desaturase/sphingolipid hydroxylase (fatty acid hydroxylase superfamily)
MEQSVRKSGLPEFTKKAELTIRLMLYYIVLVCVLWVFFRNIFTAAGEWWAGRNISPAYWMSLSLILGIAAEAVYVFYLDRSFSRSGFARLFRFSVTHEADLYAWALGFAAPLWLNSQMMTAYIPLIDLGGMKWGWAAYLCFWSFRSFIWHWLCHKVPALWEMHKMHHSATELTAFTMNRGHNLLVAFEVLFVQLFVSMRHEQIIAVISVLYLLAFLHHSQLCFRFGWLGQIILSPYAHRIHHLKDPAYQGKNFGADFTIWDRLFGTFLYDTPMEPKEMEKKFGLEATEAGASGKGFFLWELLVALRCSFAVFAARLKSQRSEL